MSTLLQLGESIRPCNGEKWVKQHLLSHVLQKGPVPPSSSSPCSHVPGGSGHCPALTTMNFAARAPPLPPPLQDTTAFSS
ncbi:hypothetical protein M5689_005951 [Euphorbia peplus]|nr:hypothetical protein M5689_005951 [Euphorbia peplus]